MDILQSVSHKSYVTVEMDNSAWGAQAGGGTYKLVYGLPRLSCIDIARSKLILAANPGLSPEVFSRLTPCYDFVDINNIELVIKRTLIDDLHLWQPREIGLGHFMISDTLHDEWANAKLGPMDYFRCIEE